MDALYPRFAVLTDTAVDTHRVTVRGELDMASGPKLARALDDPAATGTARTFVDMSEVGFIDSDGMRTLVEAGRRAEATGRELRLVSASPAVRRTLELTGFARRFAYTYESPATRSRAGCAR
jgi:anti-anti-sigma factor